MDMTEETKEEEIASNNADAVVQNKSDTDVVEQNDSSTQEINENATSSDVLDVVAIPFIMDGDESIQIFSNSMFVKNEDCDAIGNAEKYFFGKFNDDDEPKWDGVLACMYNFTKHEIVKDDRNGFINKRDFKSRWLWNVPGSNENVTFNVKCTMPKAWASHFQSFLKEMEKFGNKGHSGQLSFMADGGKNFKPTFKFSSEYDSVEGIKPNRFKPNSELLFDAG